VFERSPVHILDIRDVGDDVVRVYAALQWVNSPNVDEHGRLKLHSETLDPVACPHCKPVDPHVHPIVTADGNLSAILNHFDDEHWQHAEGEAGSRHAPACDCPSRQMTEAEIRAFAERLIRARYPEQAGRSLL